MMYDVWDEKSQDRTFLDENMSIILYSDGVQTHPWHYRDVTATDIVYTPGAVSEKGTLDLDCCACCCLKSRPICCGVSKPLFHLNNWATLIQNGILTKEEYYETMMEFTRALRGGMCCYPCYCCSSVLYVVPVVGCLCCCCQRCESKCIISSLNDKIKELNVKHSEKQISWSAQYEKPKVSMYFCCLPFNFMSLKAVAAPPKNYSPPEVVANPIQQGPRKSLGESLKEVATLRDQGVLTDKEFATAKENLIKSSSK